MRAAGETGAQVLEQHRDTVELSRLAWAVLVGIGDGILVNPQHRLDHRVEPLDGFRRLRGQFLSGELFCSNSTRKRQGIVLVPLVPAHRQTGRSRHRRIPLHSPSMEVAGER